MVRPGFARLPQAQQELVLRASLDEFAQHGFHGASLNRIIDAAGISKGSMYHYFEGKEHLYAFVARTELMGLIARVGAPPQLDQCDADTFWSEVEDYYLRLVKALTASPPLAALLRDWVSASKSPGFQSAKEELEQESLPWMERALDAGRRSGAIRDDLPLTLLITVALGMGEAMDVWLMSQQPDESALPDMVGTLMGMLRRAIGPVPG